MAKVLIIEDDLYERDLYKKVLENAGHSVMVAADGQSGYEFAFKSPDVILLDIMLPGKNGLTLLQDIKSQQQTKHIPVLVLSNLGQDNIIQEALKSGAVDYLLKSNVETNELIEKIQSILETTLASE